MATKTYQIDSKGLFIEKDPAEYLDYSFDWSVWLSTAASDTISSSTWSAEAGVTLSNPAFVGAITTVYVGGGTDENAYRVTNTIVTAGGRTARRSFRIVIKPQ